VADQRVAVVTAGAGAIGPAIVAALADAGHRTVVVDRAECDMADAAVVVLRVEFTAEGSVITMEEKREHFFDIQDTARHDADRRVEIESRARAHDAYDRRVAPPSRAAQTV
jgi:NAD(P)-dependent dehydrogenase (short-subunit alcohol dehydrogenase family)